MLSLTIFAVAAQAAAQPARTGQSSPFARKPGNSVMPEFAEQLRILTGWGLAEEAIARTDRDHNQSPDA